jgi:hypothetical protein
VQRRGACANTIRGYGDPGNESACRRIHRISVVRARFTSPPSPLRCRCRRLQREGPLFAGEEPATLAFAHKQPHVGAAADDRLARLAVTGSRSSWRLSDRPDRPRRMTSSQRRRSQTPGADDARVGGDLVSAYGLSARRSHLAVRIDNCDGSELSKQTGEPLHGHLSTQGLTNGAHVGAV